MGNYKKQIRVLLSPATFARNIRGVENGRDRNFNILLYYLGCRCSEALNLTYENVTYDTDHDRILVQVRRLKHSKTTPPNPLYFDSPFVSELSGYLTSQRAGRIFPYCRTTGYYMVKRGMGFYPHYYRMNRLSQFLDQGYGILDIRNWFGVTVRAMDYYLVEKQLSEMGKGLK